jgi:hypothetical protein
MSAVTTHGGGTVSTTEPEVEGAKDGADAPFDVYDHHSDPFVGEAVVLTTDDGRIGGRVVKAVIHTTGDQPLVHIARPDGETARVPWRLVETVNSRISVEAYGCGACGAISTKCYRCSECGHDLAGKGATVARDAGGDA